MALVSQGLAESLRLHALGDLGSLDHMWSSRSEEIQTGCDLATPAGTAAASACIWMLSIIRQLPQHLPEVKFASRNSSRAQIGNELGKAYISLSQAIAAGDLLYKAPALISHKRAEAMRFQLPEGSLTAIYLQLFLQQSSDLDEDLLRLILLLGRIGSFAVRQQLHTTAKVDQIRDSAFWEFRPLVVIIGVSPSEAELRTRLREHFTLLADVITEADIKTRGTLQAFVGLTSTTELIRRSSVEDRQQFLRMKEEVGSQ